MSDIGHRIDERTKASVIRWHSQGVPLREIAKRELISVSSVQKILQNALAK